MRALSLYRDQSPGVRLHTRLRAWSAPLDAVVAAFPLTGRMLDIGCGHGLVANEIALRRSEARVLGIDLSETKIASARTTAGTRPNVEFRHVALEDVAESGFDAVGLIDVLYLVPEPSWAPSCCTRSSPRSSMSALAQNPSSHSRCSDNSWSVPSDSARARVRVHRSASSCTGTPLDE